MKFEITQIPCQACPLFSASGFLYEKFGCDPNMSKYSGWNPYAGMDSDNYGSSRVIEKAGMIRTDRRSAPTVTFTGVDGLDAGLSL